MWGQAMKMAEASGMHKKWEEFPGVLRKKWAVFLDGLEFGRF